MAAVSGQFARIVVHVMTRAATRLAFGDLADGMKRAFPRLAGRLEPAVIPLPDDTTFAVQFHGIVFSIIPVPVPLPRTEWAESARLDRQGRFLGLASHQGHIIISPLSPPKDRQDALAISVLATVLAAAVATAREALAVCWFPAGTLSSANDFVDHAQQMIADTSMNTLPLDVWIDVRFAQNSGRYVAQTAGLSAFAVSDLQLVDTRPDPAVQSAQLFDIALHAIKSNTVFRNGDTVTVGGRSREVRRVGDIVSFECVAA